MTLQRNLSLLPVVAPPVLLPSRSSWLGHLLLSGNVDAPHGAECVGPADEEVGSVMQQKFLPPTLSPVC